MKEEVEQFLIVLFLFYIYQRLNQQALFLLFYQDTYCPFFSIYLVTKSNLDRSLILKSLLFFGYVWIFGSLFIYLMEQITLTWSKLTATAGDKTILNKTSGFCKPGELLAVMGPSGSGKTTLLSLLTHKQDPKLVISGQVLANKVEFNAQSFYNFGTFIYQNDLLYQTLTVKETLQFGARLTQANEERATARVEQLVSEFELQRCLDILVGGQFKKGISGGQKKRLCIAVEMISNPSLLVLDEPTSGLDSNKAARVLKVLRRLAQEGHTIVFTIHQPSHLLFSQLDRLIVLNYGQTVYQGPANGLAAYLQRLGVQVPSSSTISDFMMMELSQYKKVKMAYQTPFNAASYKKYLKKSVRKESEILSSEQEAPLGYGKREVQTSFWRMFQLLLQRQWANYLRNPMKFFGMIGNSLIMLIIVGVFFIDSVPSVEDINAVGASSTSSIEFYKGMSYEFIKAQGTSFVSCTSNIMCGIFSVALSFPLQRPIYYKETSSKKYWPIAYFLAKLIIQAGSVVVGALAYSVAAYWLMGFTHTGQQFILFALTMGMVALVGNSIGFFTGSLFQDVKKASSLSPVLLLPLMMFSGIYNRLSSIPVWISWLQYISPFRYGLHMLLLNQYHEAVFTYGNNIYDYRKDLSITLNFTENLVVLIAISVLFYTCAFFLLKRSKQMISV